MTDDDNDADDDDDNDEDDDNAGCGPLGNAGLLALILPSIRHPSMPQATKTGALACWGKQCIHPSINAFIHQCHKQRRPEPWHAGAINAFIHPSSTSTSAVD